MRRALWALVVAVPLIVLLALGFRHDPNAIASPLINKPAPAFVLHSLDGRTVSLHQFRGRPVVLNFWASWCVTCIAEHPYLAQAWRSYGARVAFVGVDYQDNLSDARHFLQRRGGGWPALRDPGQQTALNYGVGKIPETYFIDASGVVRYKEAGMVDPHILDTQINRLLGGRR